MKTYRILHTWQIGGYVYEEATTAYGRLLATQLCGDNQQQEGD